MSLAGQEQLAAGVEAPCRMQSARELKARLMQALGQVGDQRAWD